MGYELESDMKYKLFWIMKHFRLFPWDIFFMSYLPKAERWYQVFSLIADIPFEKTFPKKNP